MRFLLTLLIPVVASAQTLDELKAMEPTECMDGCVAKGVRTEACTGYTACAAMCENVCYEVSPVDMGLYYVEHGEPSDSLRSMLNPRDYRFERNHYMIVTTKGSGAEKAKDLLSTGLKVAAVAAGSRTGTVGAIAGSLALDSFSLIGGAASVDRLANKDGTFKGIRAEFVNDVALIEFFESNGWHFRSVAAAKDGAQQFVFTQPADNECE